MQAGRIAFATIGLAQADYQGYYRGFANGMLWPLLHSRVGLSEFRRTELAAYLAVNTAFAKALVPLLRADDTIWVHDYHLFPLGQALRDAGVSGPIGFFLHAPSRRHRCSSACRRAINCCARWRRTMRSACRCPKTG